MEEEVKLKIFGMTCDDCVNTITRSLKEQNGVMAVGISLKEGIGMIKIDGNKIRKESLLKNPVFSGKSHYKAILKE